MSFSPMKPLLNRTIVVACSAKKMVELVAGLEEMGGNALPFPVIQAQEIEEKELLDRSLASLHTYAWIIFTSAYSVSFFMKRLNELGTGTQYMPKICAIGPATAKTVKEFGYEVALVPEQFIAEGIVEALGKLAGGLHALAGQHILLPRAREGRELLPTALIASGAFVDVVPCYQTVRAEFGENAIQRLRTTMPDLIVFTSSSTVRNMIDILGQEDGKRMLLESVVAVLGPVTASTAESFGKRAEIIPKENTIASLLEEIRAYFGRDGSTVDSRQ
jgi:uroporphyrinogen III methyltransferase / synthase